MSGATFLSRSVIPTVGTALHEELDFELRLDPGDESPVVRIVGGIDRIDRLPSGGIEILDYKTGKPGTQKTVDDNRPAAARWRARAA